MKLRLKQGDRGAVALMTSIIISILLTIITTGLVSVMASELRQSSDAEQSTLAFYAAQSGVEDGVQKVLARLQAHDVTSAAQACDSTTHPVVLSTTVSWTCQSIKFSGTPEGVLPGPEQAVNIDIAGAPVFDTMVLSWDASARPNNSDFNMGIPLPATGWTGAPAIELTELDYNIIARPSTGSADNVNLGVLPAQPLNNPYSGHCVNDPDKQAAGDTNPYHCFITVTGWAGSHRGYVFRLRSRYSGTAYRLEFFNGGVPVDVPDGTATIDVTAKAGSVSRRVISKVPIINGALGSLNYVIFTDNNICKNYEIVAGLLNGDTYPCAEN
jgi:hypothetical protein